MKLCPRCYRRMRPGLSAVHLSGECARAWYQRATHKPRGRPRKQDDDLPAEVIERIMARRAAEQRYERAKASDA